MLHIKVAAEEATLNGVELLVLPECALSGYPQTSPFTINEIDFQKVVLAKKELEQLATDNHLCILTGTAECAEGKYYNSAILAMPGKETYTVYRKRALWGWDAENFSSGDMDEGVFKVNGFRIGVRICFEVRFPEYFRELYRKNVDCAVIIFNDTSEADAIERYDLIKAHLRTRAVENVFPVISVNSSAINQTAPSAVIDKDGRVILESIPHTEQLLVYDLKKSTEDSFGAKGRRQISETLAR